ncbi:Hypothetical protein CCH01_007040 [Clostridium chauvoei JF4335]|uniref:Uncharacterized protein n=1 Tax=Clostridium chauvoei JF4335 TaxID=1351755 RepID=S6F8P7_9CLOT|nr:hypothetical protein [Clostridium chauvoei]ATD54777.1 hypothetical protein BTM20_05800 [Clostridium chauvoei]ATD57543.1 hypothetical protein BTM21_07260 [Clostridium chauvoei]QBJ75060.1 hypothetical protein C6H62_05040 [Clostridium chauvoei]CDG01418.1 Hypothetical protein CCH01_007040 [Clostridium chauvoei JF4335]SLK16299.1 Hypothetical protein CCH01_10280 [Clostridium chauvoei JF4335]
MNFATKRETITFLTILILFILLSFFNNYTTFFHYIIDFITILIIIYILYASIFKRLCIKKKRKKFLGNHRYSFKPTPCYSTLFVIFILIFNFFSSSLNNYFTGTSTSVEVLNLVSVLIALLFSFIYDFKNETAFYENGILTCDGEAINYDDILKIEKFTFSTTIKYKIKVKNYYNKLELLMYIEDIDIVNNLFNEKFPNYVDLEKLNK